MKLKLHVTSYKGATPSDSLSISLNQQSATIGRLEDNTLVLPDAMRYLSGHHARIEYRAPDYYIVDTSTNGVFINHSPTPLGHGNSVKLQNQGLLSIGDYDIAVEISEESQEIPVTPQIKESELINEAIEFPDDPFADVTSDPVKQMIESNELIPDDWKINKEKTPDPFDIPAADSAQEDLEQSPELDRVPSYQEAFQPFKEESKAAADTRETASEESSAATPKDIFSEDWLTKDKFDKQNEADFIAVEPLTSQAPQSDKKDNQPHAEVETAQPPPVSSENQDDLIQSFLRGANLKDERLARSITADTFHTIGSMLRASIQGAMDVLASRARIKSEMHLDVTTIRPIENNPIKFSVSADEALAKLLLQQDKGYLLAEEAVNEAFNDIRAHQMSVIAGMQTALIAILQRFDPEKLEHRLQKQSPMSASIPIRKQAMLWDLFEQLYEEIGHEAEDDFYHLFGQAFAESYDEQIKKFKAAKDEMPIE
ncbi:MAG: type VI secretion system-associated FHA domain protein TagH [Gammaproteobacteria bacterium]|nr:type VI secretion system-associated FHA domain protein TagH [Gammaproteobacteria bacterium]